MNERLQKVIASCGFCSRRKAEEYILQGRVKVNGVICDQLGTKVSEKDVIQVDDTVLERETLEYYMVNKPTQVICSVGDKFKRKSVVELVKTDKRLYPVGRLDYYSSGLILLTNDGNFTYQMIHPKFELEKEYEVTIRQDLSEEAIQEMKKGVCLEDGTKYQPVIVKGIQRKENQTSFHVVLHEGKNREIRRIMKHFHYSLIRLHRVRFGNLTLDGLKSGHCRPLSKKEIQSLLDLVKGNHS